MGCYIRTFVEVRERGKWNIFEEDHFTLSEYDRVRLKKDKGESPFDCQDYDMFGFLADVRNRANCFPISKPKGLPYDSEYLNEAGYDSGGLGWMDNDSTRRDDLQRDYNSHSYLTARELLEFNYEKTFVNQWEGSNTYDKEITYREHLGLAFFVHLEELKQLGEPDDVRIVFYFF